DEDDDYDDIPLQHKRPFGSGLHRKQAIAFVPASDSGRLKSVDDTSPPAKPRPNIADLYLSMVLPKDERAKSAPPQTSPPPPPPPPPPDPSTSPSQCPICNLPLNHTASPSPSPSPSTSTSQPAPQEPPDEPQPPHEYTLAHQLCLPHSHPPSSVDRSRKGLAILAAHGWDPDARRGLGAAQQGTPFPVKARAKDDRLGVGVQRPRGGKGRGPSQAGGRRTELLLGARKVRKLVREEVRRGERVREELFGDGRVERYLGRG
ncbi:hypothetical protein BT67DRAFT_352576, partial [Trichocladium antarcticum]